MRSASDLTARARIRDAAMARFGADGVAATTVRTVAADAGVSAGLVLHHFGSKDGLRQACDEHVAEAIRGGVEVPDAETLTGMLDATTPVRRYLARALLDGTETAARLFTELVDRTQEWLAAGEAEGWARPTADPRARAVTYVSWQLAPLVLSRLLGGDTADTTSAVHGARAGLEMLTGGLFTDDRWLALVTAVDDKGERP